MDQGQRVISSDTVVVGGCRLMFGRDPPNGQDVEIQMCHPWPTVQGSQVFGAAFW